MTVCNGITAIAFFLNWILSFIERKIVMSDFQNDNIGDNMNNSPEQNTNADVSATVGDTSAEPVQPAGNRALKELGSWVMCIIIAVAIALVLRNFVFTVVKVDGSSMGPTLEDGQRLFTRIIGYEPQRGDIIIFHPKSNTKISYVKRVIALEGDRIWIDESTGDVHLKKRGSDKWEVLDEDYIAEKPLAAGIAQRFSDDSGEEGLLIEKGKIFVMGDNRNNSNDSRNDLGDRAVGQVSKDLIVGKAVFRWWPVNKAGVLH